MKKVFSIGFLIFGLFVFGCAARPVMPVSGNLSGAKDLAQVKKAITLAAAEKGWVSKEAGARNMELSLVNRSHMVKVNVEYSLQDYTITYKDSMNMDYNPARNSIHPKYGKWLDGLKRAIEINLMKL